MSSIESGREQQVRDLAYSIWEREGRPSGRDVEHWMMAERELSAVAMAPARKPRKAAKPAAANGPGVPAPAAAPPKPKKAAPAKTARAKPAVTGSAPKKTSARKTVKV